MVYVLGWRVFTVKVWAAYYTVAAWPPRWLFFFFNDTATTEIYTLSLHDALPIWPRGAKCHARTSAPDGGPGGLPHPPAPSPQMGKADGRNSTPVKTPMPPSAFSKKKLVTKPPDPD